MEEEDTNDNSGWALSSIQHVHYDEDQYFSVHSLFP